MASYKIYFLNFCHLNCSFGAVAKPAKLHFATLRACFIEKVDFVPFLPCYFLLPTVEQFKFSMGLDGVKISC
jgi:hypothetical protein